MKRQLLFILAGAVVLPLSGVLTAQDLAEPAEHPDCSFFVKRDRAAQPYRLSLLTRQVAKMMSASPNRSAIKSFEDQSSFGTIDKYLFAEMQANHVTPANKTDDFEFIRRVTLDLTGRIPTRERVLSFTADKTADKRAKLIDELLAKPEWVDKWTMYYGDLYGNTDRNTFVVRYEPTRNAFYKWIKDSLAANKPYNQMATELITARGENSYVQGELAWLVGARVIGNPQQDNIDQEAANIAETFLGVSHMNCVLCHNGRGHLDALSLWGKTMTRPSAWNFASFLSRTTTVNIAVPNAVNNQPYYWAVRDDPRLSDYLLNTTTGNRPARQPIGTIRTMAPEYPFTGEKPAAGENYRDALARFVTSDIQFARATVNYIWKEFFGRGIVDPVNQFDPARLDPDNPPQEPWTLQPSNARLLNALAQEFVDDGFNLKTLMRKISSSEAYQLSSRYDGAWKAEYEPLFARKLVRRLWAEEIHDAVVQSSGATPNNGAGYNLTNFSSFPAGSPYIGNPTFGNIKWAMQSPDVRTSPDNGGPVFQFFIAFMRGDRDLEDRRGDGSVLQALSLMNDPFISTRVTFGQAPKDGLLYRYLYAPPQQLIDNFYLTVLSRYPTDDEKKAALTRFPNGQIAAGAESLLWTLYNKVDFVFNY
jgi:hypothetical protein